MWSQIPNLLTLIRIAACPILVLLLHKHHYAWTLCLFLAAGITDGLDGFIAKRFNWVSRLGAILDPIADKLLIACAYVMLVILTHIPFWLLIVVMFRDLVIIVGYLILVMMEYEIPMRPSYTSKINTFVQISLVVAVLLEQSRLLPLPFMPLVVEMFVVGVLVTTVVSGLQYVWHWGIKQEFARPNG